MSGYGVVCIPGVMGSLTHIYISGCDIQWQNVSFENKTVWVSQSNFVRSIGDFELSLKESV